MKHFLSTLMIICTLVVNTLPVAAADNTVTVSFAGDCTLGAYKGSSNSFGSYWSQNTPDYFFSGVSSVFGTDDITFVNLEGPLTTHPQELVKTFSMRGEPEYVNALRAGSIEAVNIANNHTLDCGTAGLEDTKTLLASNSIAYAGNGGRATLTRNGITVGFLGYNGWTNDQSLKNQILEDITYLKTERHADVICVEFHWGIEREYYPNTVQKDLARFAIDSGADAVIGSHPHVLQGMEMYNGKVIAYSLGNFCFGGNSNPYDKDTAILQITFDKQGNNISTKVIPCTLSSVDSTNDFRPTIQSGTERGTKILERLKTYSSGFETTLTDLQ